MKYIIVTLVKNEQLFIPKLVEGVASQSIVPFKWVIINDSSIDSSLEILEKYSKTFKWIEIYTINENRKRGYGSVIAELRNIAYSIALKYPFDFIAHLDADIILPNNYYKLIFQKFKENPKLGVCGGYLISNIKGINKIEKSDKYHVRDAIRVYKRACFEDIGGKVIPIWNHDGIDTMEALRKGWDSYHVDVEAIHLRPTADSQKKLKFFYKSGYEYYKIGTSFLLIIFRAIKSSSSKPYFISGLAFIFGYLSAFINREKKYIEPQLAKFINDYHRKRIFKKINRHQ